MSIKMEKDLILRIYCLARQADRSISFALRSSWESFREFYDDDRVNSLKTMVNLLPSIALPSIAQKAVPPITRGIVGDLTLFRVLSMPWKALFNRIRTSWRFRPIEVQLIRQVFDALVDHIQSPEKPDLRVLVQLRLDLCACEWLIEHKLFGLPILLKAARIEHFCQPDRLPHVKLEEVCERDVRQPPRARQPLQERLP